ncbi:MAG: hypothetical protein INR68_03625 [Methylobacterium mesophilicum]|nr:hypothetical protein [Methylobacterium mesophilicum]
MPSPTIARIWRGRTTPERADDDERYNFAEGILALRDKALGVRTLRGDAETCSEFMTISDGSDEQSMASFSRGEPRAIHHLPRDAEFLPALPAEVQVIRLPTSNGLTG